MIAALRSVESTADVVHSELANRLFDESPPPWPGSFLVEPEGMGLVIDRMEDNGYFLLIQWIPAWGGRCVNFWPSTNFECREADLPLSVGVAAFRALAEAENAGN